MPVADPLTASTAQCVVLRPFIGLGRTLLRGEVIDTTAGWRNVAVLVDRRYLAPLPHGAQPVTIDLDGPRTFVDQEHADSALDEAIQALEEQVVSDADITTEKPVLDTPMREEPKGKGAKGR